MLGEATEAVAIVVIVVVNGAIAIVEERRAAAALDALRSLTVPAARVRRDGTVRQIPSAEVVPGDVVLVEAGDHVPADLRLIETVALEIDESLLTGESLAAHKDAAAVTAEDAGLGDRVGTAHTGTFVTRGTATGVAVGTGAATILAAIARDATVTRRPTPLQVDLARVTRQLALVSVGVVLVLSFVRAGPGWAALQETFLAAVALAVAAVPEGLATVTAVGLALGVRRMAERGAVVRRLAAVETLGSVTVAPGRQDRDAHREPHAGHRPYAMRPRPVTASRHGRPRSAMPPTGSWSCATTRRWIRPSVTRWSSRCSMPWGVTR